MSARRQWMFGRIATVVLVSVVSVGVTVFAGALPAAAGAYATVAPQSQYSAAPGLPDGRVYEEVSPPNKYAGQAGAASQEGHGNFLKMAVARADGNGMFFGGAGGLGEAVSGIDDFFVAQRSQSGWSTRSALPRAPLLEGGPGAPGIPLFNDPPKLLAPSADLTHTVFTTEIAYTQGPAPYGIGDGCCKYGWAYLSGSNPLVEPSWLTKPLGEVTEPAVFGGDPSNYAAPVGGTPDFSTVYFTDGGTFGLPEDAPRAAHVLAEGSNTWGFYQYRNGVLSEAGVLPDGSVSQYGAVPAALAGLTDSARYADPDQLDNEVSSDGLKAFFVSPDPRAGVGVPQLYVRKTASDGSQSTVLVSQSQLPGHVGQTAPDGPAPLPRREFGSSYVFGSPDGSHAFFASTDQLTSQAPATTAVKYYDFDVETETLTYLPNVSGLIVAAAPDGSSFLVENMETVPAEMDRWSAGPEGGTVTPVAQLPGSPLVEQARTSENGSIDLFVTSAQISGFNDGGTQQIFRYDSTGNELDCISCAPAGVTSERSILSNTAEAGVCEASGSCNSLAMVDNHGISVNGDRVFFDTATPLVTQDTDDTTDVYEWENGTVFLISSGTSSNESLFLDNDANGSDVFFATVDGLAPGDTDGAYDVYDARIPHPGDNPPPSAVPCQGDVCQGPSSVPSLLGQPSSETFKGLGNVVPEVKPAVTVKSKSKPKISSAKQKLSKALKACRKKSKGKRAACESRARKTYNRRGK